MFFIIRFFSLIGLVSVILILILFFTITQITNPDIAEINQEYDAIVILSGNPERAVLASEISNATQIKKIYLSREEKLRNDYSSTTSDKRVFELYFDILKENLILPEDIILFGNNNLSTFDEAMSLQKVVKSTHKKLLIITDKFHIYRANQIFTKFMPNHEISFYAQDNNIDWSMDKLLIQIIFSETLKLTLYHLFGDFNAYKSYR